MSPTPSMTGAARRITRRPLGPLPCVLAIVVAWAVVVLASAIPAVRDGPAPMSMAMPGMSMGAGDMSAMNMSMGGMAGMGAAPSSLSDGRDRTGALAVLGTGRLAALSIWLAMIVAMMLPAALPAVRHVASNTLCWRRRRAATMFVAAYLTVWTMAGVAVTLVSPLWSSAPGPGLAASALVLAAAWQLTPFKRAALADCHRPVPLPPRGRRADLAVIRFGMRNGTSCVRSCWAMMLAMTVANTAMILWMLVLTGMTTLEKRAERPRRMSRLGSAVLAAGAVVVAVTS